MESSNFLKKGYSNVTKNNLNKCNAMNPNKALWEKGDFTRIARSMRESGEALVQSLRLTKGLKVCSQTPSSAFSPRQSTMKQRRMAGPSSA